MERLLLVVSISYQKTQRHKIELKDFYYFLYIKMENNNVGKPLVSPTPPSLIEELNSYITTLDEKEMKAYLIAKDHLGSSFQLEKSNGFLRWKKSVSS
jgi:hypothetical protein